MARALGLPTSGPGSCERFAYIAIDAGDDPGGGLKDRPVLGAESAAWRA